MRLRPNEIIRIGTRVYKVDYVNDSRAYCLLIPRAGKVRMSGSETEEETVWASVKGINISPNASVERLTEEDLAVLNLEQPKPEQESEMAVAGIPLASKSKARSRADRHSGIGTSKGTGNLARAKKTQEEKIADRKIARKKVMDRRQVRLSDKKCLCGCGTNTTNYFAPGHDSKFKSWMVKVERGDMAPEQLPASVRKAYDFKKRGPGMVTSRNYKGEPHSGYLNE